MDPEGASSLGTGRTKVGLERREGDRKFGSLHRNGR